jgi:hypothetical protein
MTKVKINKHEKSDAEDDENDSDDDDDDEGDDNQHSHIGSGDQSEINRQDEQKRGNIEYKLSGKNFDLNFVNDSINSSNSQYFYNNAYNSSSSDQQSFNRLPTLMINNDSVHTQQTQHIYTWMKDNRQTSSNTNMIFTQQQNTPVASANNLTSPCKLNQNGAVNFYFDKSSPVNINETQLSSSDSGSSPTISSTNNNNNNNNSSCLSVNQSDSLVSITGKTS